MEKVRELINSVKEGKNGYSLNKPWRLEKTSYAVIPIIKKSEEERSYITFAEAQDVKVEDTGQIDFVYVKNNEDKPLLICRGEIFKGKTQERAAIHDYLIMPGKGNRVSVRCIHASKGIQSGAEMTYGGRTSYAINLSDQSKTWNTVKTTVSGYYNGSATTNISNEPSTVSTSNTTTINGRNISTNTIEMPFVSENLGRCNSSGPGTANVCNNNSYNDVNEQINLSYGFSGTRGPEGESGTSGSSGKKENIIHTLNQFTTTQISGSIYATPGTISGWNTTQNYFVSNGSGWQPNTGTKMDDYTTAFQDMKMRLKDIMKKVPYIKNQVGAILFKENEIYGLDIYDHPDSWEQIKQDIIAKEGSEFMKNPEDEDLFVLNHKAFKKIVSKKLPDTFEEKIVYNKEYTVIELKSETLVGEVLIQNDKVLHLTLWNKNN